MQTLKQKGFTLIELLVVIVIIGILATISVATFSGYFAKARDSERQAAIRNAATIMKTARAVETITGFVGTWTSGTPNTLTVSNPGGQVALLTVLSDEGGYAIPADSTANSDYYYVYQPADEDEFAFFACSEENAGSAFTDGTSALVATVTAAAAALCDGAAVIAADLGAGQNAVPLSGNVVGTQVVGA